MVVVYKILYFIQFLFVLLMVFIWFAFTWNLIADLLRFKDCIPDRVRIEYTEDRASAGGSTFFRYGYLNTKIIYLEDNKIQNDTTLDVWRTTEGNNLHAYARKLGETTGEFKYRLVSKFARSLLICVVIFIVLHIITILIKKNVYIEELKPSPPKSIFDY
jgi:hypothetical protein